MCKAQSCSHTRFCRQRVATAASPRLSLISNQSRARAQGRFWTRAFSAFCLRYFTLSSHSPLVLKSSPAILFHYFTPCFYPCSFSPLPPLYFQHFHPPKPNPVHLSRGTFFFLSVNSFILFLVCWPRLTHFPLSLFQLSLRRLSFCLLGFFPIFPFLLDFSGKHIHTHRHTHNNKSAYVPTQTHLICVCTNTDATHKKTVPSAEWLFPGQHTHTHSSSGVIMMKLFQGSNLTEVLNWTDKKVILSFN